MKVELENVKPMDIEKRSFEIITEELGDKKLVPGLCHVCICHNAGTVFDSSNCFLNCILRETEILCIIKVCACTSL